VKQVLEAVFRHPLGSGEMGLPGSARTPRLPLWIDAQNDSGNICPVGTLSLGVQQAQVRYRVPLVISGEDKCCWSDIVSCGIKWRR
jgi:hypothetical protein